MKKKRQKYGGESAYVFVGDMSAYIKAIPDLAAQNIIYVSMRFPTERVEKGWDYATYRKEMRDYDTTYFVPKNMELNKALKCIMAVAKKIARHLIGVVQAESIDPFEGIEEKGE